MAPGDCGSHWDPKDHLLVAIIKFHSWEPVPIYVGSVLGIGRQSEAQVHGCLPPFSQPFSPQSPYSCHSSSGRAGERDS